MPRREWFIPQKGYRHVEETDFAPRSLFWYCFQCGERYAEARVFPAAIWYATAGCCSSCSGSIYSVPGCLEALHLVGKTLPGGITRYQLDCEIAFLSNPAHPHNKALPNGT